MNASSTRDRDAPDAVTRLGSLLLAGHGSAAGIAASDLAAITLSRDEAYRVQAACARELGRTIGWKVGRKSPQGDVAYAPLFENRLQSTGVTLARDAFRVWQVEAEIMVRFGRALPSRDRPYDRQTVADAIAEVMPAFEIIDSRYADWPDLSAPLLLADLLSHGAMVAGPAVPFAPAMALERRRVRLTIDDEVVVDQEGGNPAGDLVELFTVLANALASAGAGIGVGDLVTTGSFTGLRLLPPGARAEAWFADIGSVAVLRAA